MRTLSVELLESRSLFAAVADVVFLLDESGSQAFNAADIPSDEFQEGSGGAALRPWVSGFVQKLESKLALRGIGGAGTPGNKYGVIAFGVDSGEPPRARPLSVGNNNLVDASQVDDLLAQFINTGSSEDGWAAISRAIGVDSIAGAYTFRPDAAVHFVLVTDEARDTPQMNPLTGSADPYLKSWFFSILNELRDVNILTNDANKKILEDATVTTVANFNFETLNILENGDFGAGSVVSQYSPRILGIDVDNLDGIQLDRNSANPDGDVLAGAPDDLVIFTRRTLTPGGPTPIVDAVVKQGTNKETILDTNPNVNYIQVRNAFKNPCLSAGNCTADQYDQFNNDQDENSSGLPGVVGQNDFEREEYAFLTWEARGTAFDFGIIRNSDSGVGTFTGWEASPPTPPPAGCLSWESVNCRKQWIQASRDNFLDFNISNSLINQFNQTIIDDIFEKVLIQRVDFDGFFTMPAALSSKIPIAAKGPGRLSVGDIDMMTYYILNPVEQTEKITRAMDLDGNGIVQLADRTRLVTILFATWFGDANLDGVYNSADWVLVWGAGEYGDAAQDNSSWMEGDFTGDLDFLSTDLNFALGYQWQSDGIDNDGDGQTDESGEGYRDLNGDKQDDFRPIWARHLAAGLGFYRPSWG